MGVVGLVRLVDGRSALEGSFMYYCSTCPYWNECRGNLYARETYIDTGPNRPERITIYCNKRQDIVIGDVNKGSPYKDIDDIPGPLHGFVKFATFIEETTQQTWDEYHDEVDKRMALRNGDLDDDPDDWVVLYG